MTGRRHVDELEPRIRSARTSWAVLLGGPVAWYLYFWAVYLLAEAACAPADPPELAGVPVASLMTIGATVVAAVFTLALAIWTFRRWKADGPLPDTFTDPLPDDHPRPMSPALADGDLGRGRQLTFAGFALSCLFFVATVFVGLPAVLLAPC